MQYERINFSKNWNFVFFKSFYSSYLNSALTVILLTIMSGTGIEDVALDFTEDVAKPEEGSEVKASSENSKEKRRKGVAKALESPIRRLNKHRRRDSLKHGLSRRPAQHELIQRNILRASGEETKFQDELNLRKQKLSKEKDPTLRTHFCFFKVFLHSIILSLFLFHPSLF